MVYAASIAAATAGIDVPTLLLTALGGAVVAALAGIIGAIIQGRREHSKWVREQRYTAYTAFAAAVAHLHSATAAHPQVPEAAVIHAAIQALSILGPKSMKEVATRLVDAENADHGYQDALNAYYLKANKVLKIGL
jgi:predicted benzoate:H+ symporter BenE